MAATNRWVAEAPGDLATRQPLQPGNECSGMARLSAHMGTATAHARLTIVEPSGSRMRQRLRYRSIALPVLLAAGAAGLLVARATARRSGNARVPEPAKSVDLARYAGLWHELGRYDNRFERGCEAVTAEYVPRPDGLIQVINTCREGTPDGRVRFSKGRAKVIEGSDNAKLRVSFFGPFFLGKYWVLDHADDYTWSIVGEPSGRYLWILTRVASPSADVKTALIERAQALGYDTTMFRYTRQSSA